MEYAGFEKSWEEFGVDEKTWKDPSWQVRNSIRRPEELSLYVDLSDAQIGMIGRAIKSGKPMRITPYYASLMGKNPTGVEHCVSVSDDVSGIFVQSVPTPAHYLFKAGMPDPMSEGSRSVGAAYQRYVDRVALMSSPSSICHMYCTHCQRGKDMEKNMTMDLIEEGIRYIRDNENVHEVLGTGGDFLALPVGYIKKILSELSEIDHVESIRVASRLPVTNPFSITDEKMDVIAKYSKHSGGGRYAPNIYVVTHANSPDELTWDMQDSISMMRRYGLDVRNQTVLLKGVNDDFSSLSKLCKDMHHMGINPRYLFQCHKVDGLATEIVPINVGQSLVSELRGQEGSSIPIYAVNMTGGGGKVVLTPSGDNGFGDFSYKMKRDMRTWENKLVEYEELLRIRESDYENGMKAMSEFYGDVGIMDYAESDVGGVNVRESASRKFRPSLIVVDDKNQDKVLYVTNVTASEPMDTQKKLDKMGFYRNGERLGIADQPYVTNPSDFGRHAMVLKSQCGFLNSQ